jgi:hypothetical protein
MAGELGKENFWARGAFKSKLSLAHCTELMQHLDTTCTHTHTHTHTITYTLAGVVVVGTLGYIAYSVSTYMASLNFRTVAFFGFYVGGITTAALFVAGLSVMRYGGEHGRDRPFSALLDLID